MGEAVANAIGRTIVTRCDADRNPQIRGLFEAFIYLPNRLLGPDARIFRVAPAY